MQDERIRGEWRESDGLVSCESSGVVSAAVSHVGFQPRRQELVLAGSPHRLRVLGEYKPLFLEDSLFFENFGGIFIPVDMLQFVKESVFL